VTAVISLQTYVIKRSINSCGERNGLICKYRHSVFTNIDKQWLQYIDIWLLVHSDELWLLLIKSACIHMNISIVYK